MLDFGNLPPRLAPLAPAKESAVSFFVGCMLMGAVLFLASLFRARRDSGLWLPAHLCSMIGFGMGTGLAAGTTGAIACAMAAINGMCALAVLLLRVEQDS